MENKLIKDFDTYLTINNYSKGTIYNYCKDIEIFYNFLQKYMDISIKIKDFNIFILSQVKQHDIIAFIVYLNVKRKNGSQARLRKIASIRKFYKYLISKYPKINNPVNNYWIETTERMPKVLSLKQAKEIQNIFNKNNHKEWERDNLIIKTFLLTGIRLSELINIKKQDIDFNKKIIKIISKGNKEKIVYMPKILLNDLKKYSKNKQNYVFTNKNNTKLSASCIQYNIKKAYDLMQIGDRGYTVHTLRHTSATILYESTKDILLVKEFLGHNSVLSTQIYSHVSNDLIKNAVNKNPLNII